MTEDELSQQFRALSAKLARVQDSLQEQIQALAQRVKAIGARERQAAEARAKLWTTTPRQPRDNRPTRPGRPPSIERRQARDGGIPLKYTHPSPRPSWIRLVP